MKAKANIPYLVASYWKTGANPSVECFVKEKEVSAIVLEDCYFGFVENPFTSLAHSQVSDH